jgi:hypothetical protein
VWELRFAAGTDPLTGHTMQRSVTFRGTETDAEAYRAELAAEYAARRSASGAAPMLEDDRDAIEADLDRTVIPG